MKNVFFEPWVGKDYHSGGIFKKRILVLGESHYCGSPNCMGKCGLKNFPEGCEDLTTTGVIEKYLSGFKDGWTNTWLKFERSLVNKVTSIEDSNAIWNSLAFYNFLQVAMQKAREGGTFQDYEDAREAFLEVIELLKPELIIVWGVTRLFDNLPDKGWIPGDEKLIDNYPIRNGYYQLVDGTKSRVIGVYHPSTGYTWDWWYKVICTEL